MTTQLLIPNSKQLGRVGYLTTCPPPYLPTYLPTRYPNHLPTHLPSESLVRAAHATPSAPCLPAFCGRPRGSACTVTIASTFAHHCTSSMILICAADHNSLSVSQRSSSIDSVNYDDATIAQRCPMTHVCMSSCGDHVIQAP